MPRLLAIFVLNGKESFTSENSFLWMGGQEEERAKLKRGAKRNFIYVPSLHYLFTWMSQTSWDFWRKWACYIKF